MNPYIGTLRAITVLFLRSVITKAAIIVVIGLVVFYMIITYLATSIDSWWWLALIPVVTVTSLLFIIGGALWFTTYAILPKGMTRQDKRRVSKFTNDMLSFIEEMKMPLPLIAGKIAWDIARHQDSAVVEQTINKSKGLSQEFRNLVEMMRDIGS